MFDKSLLFSVIYKLILQEIMCLGMDKNYSPDVKLVSGHAVTYKTLQMSAKNLLKNKQKKALDIFFFFAVYLQKRSGSDGCNDANVSNS